jgi:hypothetical protein
MYFDGRKFWNVDTREAENITQLLTQLMLLKEMITTYSQNYTKHVTSFCG